MIWANIFRAPKVAITSQSTHSFAQESRKSNAADAAASEDSQQIMLELQWPHLQIVYELLLRLIIDKDLFPDAK